MALGVLRFFPHGIQQVLIADDEAANVRRVRVERQRRGTGHHDGSGPGRKRTPPSQHL
jgi:hypothetical protein